MTDGHLSARTCSPTTRVSSGTRCSPHPARSDRSTRRSRARCRRSVPADVERRQRAADLSFQARGITFAVNQGPEGLEKIMPFDLVPRIITADEWRKIERGLEQRVRALNLFLQDIYQTGRILREGIIPPELVLGSRGYRREVRGMTVPLGSLYPRRRQRPGARCVGRVLRPRRQPAHAQSGVSYVVENRRVLKRVWSQIFHGYDVRPVEGYAQDLLDVLRAIAPGDAEDEPTVVLLTPGVYNSAYFEHAFLAKGMGVQMVEGSDLFVDDGLVFMRTTHGPAARPRHLSTGRRRVPGSARVSLRLDARRAWTAGQLSHGPRDAGQRARRRRRRRQGDLRLRAEHHPATTWTRSRFCRRFKHLPAESSRTTCSTSWSTSASWWSSRSTRAAATAC